jgi:hypothetical protein
MGIELGRRRPEDAGAQRLYELITRAVADMSLASRLRVFGAFKRGDTWTELDPEIQDAFRSVSQSL